MARVVVKIAWITAKVDWISSDYYNFGDLNRVENNTEYLKLQLETLLGYTPNVINLVLNRDNTRFEFYDDLNKVEGNILALKDASYQPLEWIAPKINWYDMEQGFNYIDANRLEGNLVLLKDMIENIERNLPRCGVLICGGGHGLGYGLTSNISYVYRWLLNDDLVQQTGNFQYVWQNDEIFDFSKIFKF